MSRQMIMTRRGKPLGYIDTTPDGTQSAVCSQGSLVGTFNPRTGETMAPCGNLLADGNRLAQLLQQSR